MLSNGMQLSLDHHFAAWFLDRLHWLLDFTMFWLLTLQTKGVDMVTWLCMIVVWTL